MKRTAKMKVDRKICKLKIPNMNPRTQNARSGVKPNSATKWVTNPRMIASSEIVLKKLGNEYDYSVKSSNLIGAVIREKIGNRLRRTQRKNRREAFALAAAVYHLLANENDPAEKLKKVVEAANAKPPRGADECRSLVECFFHYGTTQQERNRNRQYAATDAHALRYVVRTGMEPEAVLKPEKNQTPTKWAKAEIEFRSKQQGKEPRSGDKEKTGPDISGSSKSELRSVSLKPGQYSVLKAWAKMGPVIGRPEKGGSSVAILVVPITGLAGKEGRARTEGIISLLEEALEEFDDSPLIRKPIIPRSQSASGLSQRQTGNSIARNILHQIQSHIEG